MKDADANAPNPADTSYIPIGKDGPSCVSLNGKNSALPQSEESVKEDGLSKQD
jgi:hypothetical protein